MPEKFSIAAHLKAAAQPDPRRVGEAAPATPAAPAAPAAQADAAPAAPPPGEAKVEPMTADEVKAKQTAPAAAPSVAAADPDDEIVAGKRAPKSEDFKRVKQAASDRAKEAKEAKDAYEKLKAEFDALKASPKSDPAELEQARKDLAAAKELQNIVALEYAPEFQSKYSAKRETVVNDLKGVVEADKLESVVSLLDLPDSPRKLESLNALIEDMPIIQQNEILEANRRMRGIRSEREAELKNANDRLSKIHAERKAQGESIRAKMDEAFSATQKSLLADNPLFKKRDGDEAWNKDVDDRIKAAQEIFHDRFDSVEQKAHVSHMAASVPTLIKQLKHWSERATTAEAQIAKLQSGSPKVGGSAPGSSPAASPSGGFAARVKQTVGAV